MSLIQEALRRQQEESGDIPAEGTPPPVQQPGGPPAAPPTPPPGEAGPPPLPPTAAAPPPPPPPPAPTAQPDLPTVSAPEGLAEAPQAGAGARPLPTLAGIAALVIILVGGGVWMLVYAFQQWQGDGTQTGTEETPPDTDNPPAVVEPDTGTDVDGGGTYVEPDTGNGSGQTTSIDPDGNDGVPPDPLNAEPLPVEWPLLQLTGVVGRGPNGSVIINNEILGVGQTIEGAKIVAIGQQGAWLVYEGEKRFLSIEFVSP